MSLLDIINKPPRSIKPKDTTPKQVVVTVLNTLHIPESDKPISEYFIDRPSVKIEVEVKTSEIFHAWFLGFCSKHPHLEYLYMTRSSWSNRVKQFWFRNTTTGITEIFSLQQLKHPHKFKSLSKRLSLLPDGESNAKKSNVNTPARD